VDDSNPDEEGTERENNFFSLILNFADFFKCHEYDNKEER